MRIQETGGPASPDATKTTIQTDIHLPDTARQLIDAIGLPATLLLIEEYAGQCFQVPKGKRAAGIARISELVGVIGQEAADKLVFNWGGEYLSVPRCKRAALAARDADLQARFDALLAAGVSARRAANQLAKVFNIAVSTVWRASKRGPTPSTPTP